MSCGEIEIGTCDICGAKNVPVSRKYYDYPNIKCECHGSYHFDIVRYCSNCEPKRPRETKITVSTEKLQKVDKLIKELKN